jgi:hypothetical protein
MGIIQAAWGKEDRKNKRPFQAPRRHGSARDVAGVPRAAHREEGAGRTAPGLLQTPFGMLATRGRIQLHAELRQWVVQARQQFPLRDAPLNLEVALTSREITLPHRDPADHFVERSVRVENDDQGILRSARLGLGASDEHAIICLSYTSLRRRPARANHC